MCDFVKISEISQNKVNVSVIASKDKISQAEFALGAATKLMDYYNDFFGIPYPLQKQGNALIRLLFSFIVLFCFSYFLMIVTFRYYSYI